jgi:hypothetical protein
MEEAEGWLESRHWIGEEELGRGLVMEIGFGLGKGGTRACRQTPL